jgi:hypothetical protein
MDASAMRTLTLEAAIRGALDNREFAVVYQPIIDTRTQRPIAVEALMRWHSPVHGTVPPDHFIPLLEENGMIVPVSRWALRRPCARFVPCNAPDSPRCALPSTSPAASSATWNCSRTSPRPSTKRVSIPRCWSLNSPRAPSWTTRTPLPPCWKPCAHGASGSRWTTSAPATHPSPT